MVTHMQTDRCPPPAPDGHELVIIGDSSAEKLVALLRSHGVQCEYIKETDSIERKVKLNFHTLLVDEFVPASGSQL